MSIAHPLASEPQPGNQFATLAGGCFWCLEAVYQDLRGVVDVESGYSGGAMQNPDYRSVCGGDTGHAEVVRIEFDPKQVTYRQILEVFFAIHDPTTLNRQGNDAGTQYRSAIYTHSDEQTKVAKEVLKEAGEAYSQPVVTELTAAPKYWRAETDHQEYFDHHPAQGYCAVVIAPKVAKFKKTFNELRKAAA